MLSFAIILSAFSSLPLSAVSTGNLIPGTISPDYSSDYWYRTYPGGSADTSTRYIEIAKEGADDVGSLHFVNDTPSGDMRVNIIKNIPAGEYTLSFKIKGSRTYSTENLWFANSRNDEGRVDGSQIELVTKDWRSVLQFTAVENAVGRTAAATKFCDP